MKYAFLFVFLLLYTFSFSQSDDRVKLRDLQSPPASTSDFVIFAVNDTAGWKQITEYNGDTVIIWHPTLKKFGFIDKDSLFSLPADNVTGNGTTNFLPLWIAPFTLGTAGISDDGSEIQFARPTVLYGVNTAAPATYGTFGIDNTLGVERPTYYNGSAWIPWLAYSGGTNQYSYFSNSNTITSGNQLFRSATGVEIGDGNYFKLPNNTTVGSMLGSTAGRMEFNTTAQNLSFRTSTATEYPVKSSTSTGIFTAGSVLFADANGRVAQDNSNLYWDDSANRLGIGTTTPTQQLQIAGNGAQTIAISSFISQLTQRSRVLFEKSRGTALSPSAIVNGDELGMFFWGGRSQAGSMQYPGGLYVVVNGTVSGTNIPADFRIQTGQNSSSRVDRVSITSGGLMGIGTISPDQLLHIELASSPAVLNYPFRITNTGVSTLTGNVGFGVGFEYEAETSTDGTNKVIAASEAVFTDATAGSEDADLIWKTVAGGTLAEYMRLNNMQLRAGNYRFNVDQDTTGTGGYVLTRNAATNEIELQAPPAGYSGWTYYDVESDSYTSVNSGDTLSIDDKNGIIDSLPNGSISIDANNNTLTIDDLNEFDINDDFKVIDTSYFNSQWIYNRNNSAEFGSSIALSGDFLLISDPAFNSTKGRVTIFKNNGIFFDSVGVINPTFTGSPGVFGRIIDGEGGYFVVSAESSNTAASRAGEAFVYKESGGTIILDDNLIASPASVDDFGARISISNTNTPTVAFGIPNRASGGAVAIFQDSTGGWVQKRQFAPSDLAVGDQFGIYTDIWNDTLVVVGSLQDDDGFSNNGAVYVFADTTGGAWSAPPIQRAKLSPGLGVSAEFGRIVQMRDSIIVVTVANLTSVYIYTRQSGTNTWVNTQVLSTNGISSFQFESISLRGDYLVIGSVANGYLGTKVYENISGTFVLVENVTAIDAVSGDNFGFAVDISEDGNTLVIGSRNDDDLGTNKGKAYVYENLLNRTEVKENLIVTDKTTGLPDFWFKDGTAIFGDYDGTKTASVLGKIESGNILAIATDGTVIEIPDSTLGSGSVTYGYIKTTQDTLANSDLTADTVAVAKFSLQSGVSSGITVPTDSTFQVNSTGVYEVSWEGDWESDTSVGESATIFFYANGSIADTIATRYPADRSNFKYTVLLSLTASTDNKIRVLGEDGDIIIYNSRLIIKKL